MGTITLAASGQISAPVEVGPGTRVETSGSGYVEWTSGTLIDVTNGTATWARWPGAVTSDSCDTLRRVVIRAVATAANFTMTWNEAENDEGASGVYWQEDLAPGFNSTEARTVTEPGALTVGYANNVNLSPSANTSGISSAGSNRTTVTGSASVTGSGHVVGGINWIEHQGTGTLAGAYATESKIDVSAGATITTAILSEAQVSSNAGTITTLVGYRATGLSNTGSVPTFYGFLFPSDVGAGYGSGSRLSFVNLDATAPIYSVASIITTVGVITPKVNLSETTTPSGSADVQGGTGDIRYDDSYIYVKCATGGWKRAALATW